MACSFLCKPWLPLTESAKPARSPAPSSRARTVVQQLAVLLLLLGGVGGGGGALLATAASTTDTILPGESITGNQTLVSKNGEFELGFFNPGVGIHYFLGVRLRKLAAYSPTFWIGDRVYIKEDGASLWWSSPSCDANGQTEHGDSFAILDNLQGLPYNAQDEPATTDEDCREACLNKCYCVAYSTETGCKLWYYDLYNLSSADKPPYSKIYVRLGSKLKSKRGLATRWMVLLVVGSVAVASAMLAVLLLCRYRRDLFGSSKFVVEGSLVVYSYAQIKKATENFSDKLGEGGFGSVFRGTLPGSTTVVAVKNLKGLGYAEKQFRAEVQTVGMIRHTNLVRLLGFCVEGNRKLLVYEYMPNGSLDAHIFSQKSSPLSWQVRYQIAIGIARGLAYLHEECEHCIIHCDIKPENILLDEEFRPKIADFGMAKLLGREFNAALTTIRGTRGYLAPEWLYGQPITKKADVYSFGIVLFEMISGIRSTVTMKFGSHRYYPSYAAAQMHEGDVLCLLDSRLEGNANVEELDITCRVACWCIQDREGDRPSMGHVVRMLEGVVDTEMPPIPASFQNLVDGDDSDIYEENWRLRTQD
uniref:non-specific serine/threonine protein kinase n=1 Tax=Oryza barthii TaxID=65489 RepID=A0A0D3EL83_9ORYZ